MIARTYDRIGRHTRNSGECVGESQRQEVKGICHVASIVADVERNAAILLNLLDPVEALGAFHG